MHQSQQLSDLHEVLGRRVEGAVRHRLKKEGNLYGGGKINQRCMVLVCKRLCVYLVSHDGGNVDNRPLASCNHRWEQSVAELKLKLTSS